MQLLGSLAGQLMQITIQKFLAATVGNILGSCIKLENLYLYLFLSLGLNSLRESK